MLKKLRKFSTGFLRPKKVYKCASIQNAIYMSKNYNVVNTRLHNNMFDHLASFLFVLHRISSKIDFSVCF